MKTTIIPQDLDLEFYTAEGCFITEISNSQNDPDVSIARARLEAGVTTRWHRLTDTAERYYILSGQGRVEIGDEPAQDVAPGDIVLIPPMCRQRIANIGSDELLFLAICTPPFSNEIYQDIE